MTYKYQLPALPYELDALEPVISKEIMNLHYNKHHQTYVNKLNEATEAYEKAQKENDLAAMIALEPAIRFNGGGHINHSIFWTNLAPANKNGGTPPSGVFLKVLEKEFGSFDTLMERLSNRAVAVQGSGWAWLGYDKTGKHLQIETCDNQNPLVTKGLVPLLGIDVWEHAYYLQYKNVRADYVKAIRSVINWQNVAERYESAAK